jgi:heme/copper-type cytochrome/quinol oxidase subunit 2
MNFNEPVNRIMYNIINFHHDLMFYLIVIAFLVLGFLLYIYITWIRFSLYFFKFSQNINIALGVSHNKILEIIWTIIPAFILFLIALPSFALLYSTDENNEMSPALTLKVTGYQWYWNYELDIMSISEKNGLFFFSNLDLFKQIDFLFYNIQEILFDLIDICEEELFYLSDSTELKPEYEPIISYIDFQYPAFYNYIYFYYENINLFDQILTVNFDAVLKPIEDLEENESRLLTTDNLLVLPVNTLIRILITAEDVIHSWTVPVFGIKLDAIPGRLNTIYLYIEKIGYFFGQCSEICGVYHNGMPIDVMSVFEDSFNIFYELNYNENILKQ